MVQQEERKVPSLLFFAVWGTDRGERESFIHGMCVQQFTFLPHKLSAASFVALSSSLCPLTLSLYCHTHHSFCQSGWLKRGHASVCLGGTPDRVCFHELCPLSGPLEKWVPTARTSLSQMKMLVSDPRSSAAAAATTMPGTCAGVS